MALPILENMRCVRVRELHDGTFLVAFKPLLEPLVYTRGSFKIVVDSTLAALFTEGEEYSISAAVSA